MIDTHIHLDLLDDGPALLAAAVAQGLTHVVSVGVDPRVSAALRGPLPGGLVVVRALGLHPQEVRSTGGIDSALASLDAQLQVRGVDVVAVGECGFDARPGIGDAALHGRAFAGQLALARRHDLPVVLHGVRRDGAMLAALDDDVATHGAARPVRGVWHGFSSSLDTMRAAVARGLYISVGVMVLNEKARRLRAAVPHIPADRLVVETDAPPLAPARLRDVVAAVAALRGTTAAAIEQQTRHNARALFAI
ncbi:MAG: TatD family deoxyribonuclease [Deltaproteobacteria bacterium]|nr:TatD family deoxyribonuclease [Deltaproteobacteria bacterium]